VSRIKKIYLDINIAHDRMCHINEQDLKTTMKQFGIELTGNMNPCPACLLYKSKIKNIPKLSTTQATKSGERIFMDTSGPFTKSLGGNYYWHKICDQYTTMSWDKFMKAKNEVPEIVEKFIEMCKGINKSIEYIRCDNAGEHQNELRNICAKHGVKLEYTAPYTPQQNGMVERRFATDRLRGNAMMEAAGINEFNKRILWAEAVNTASKLGNLVTDKDGITAYETFYGYPSR
jgi:transposase InsO family protein